MNIVSNPKNKYITKGCFLSAFIRFRSDSIFLWSPLTWFFAICGINYGLGPLIYFYGSEEGLIALDTLFVVDDPILLWTNLFQQ